MPHIESYLVDIDDKKLFIQTEFVSGYWQLPLDELSQELLSFLRTINCTTNPHTKGCNFFSEFSSKSRTTVPRTKTLSHGMA